MKKAKPAKPMKTKAIYKQLWKIVDGAVADAFIHHPDYLTEKGASGRAARISINKRVVGALTGFVEQSAKGRQSHAGRGG